MLSVSKNTGHNMNICCKIWKTMKDKKVENTVISGYDKTAIKEAYMMIAKDDRIQGMKKLRNVILGWKHISKESSKK